jgi:hypothetical protein
MFQVTTTVTTGVAYLVEYDWNGGGDFRDPPSKGCKQYFLSEYDALKFINDKKKDKHYDNFSLCYVQWLDANKPLDLASKDMTFNMPGMPYA